jgi:hypothetical protein
MRYGVESEKASLPGLAFAELSGAISDYHGSVPNGTKELSEYPEQAESFAMPSDQPRSYEPGTGHTGPVGLHRLTPSIDIAFRRATECVAKPCWVDCTRVLVGKGRRMQQGINAVRMYYFFTLGPGEDGEPAVL